MAACGPEEDYRRIVNVALITLIVTELDKTLELDEDHLFWVSYAAVQLSRFPSISFEISLKLHYQPCRHVFINTFGTALDMECSHVSYMPISGVEFASVTSENGTVKAGITMH